MPESDTPSLQAFAEFNLEDFSNQCVQAQEFLIAAYQVVAQLCAVGTEHGPGAVNTAADLFGHKADWVRRLAEIFCTWGLEDIQPQMPLNLYETAIELPDPQAALALALANDWSAAQLQNYYDAAAGRKVSRVTWLHDQADVDVTDEGILVRPHKAVPSGNVPHNAEVTIKEVLRQKSLGGKREHHEE